MNVRVIQIWMCIGLLMPLAAAAQSSPAPDVLVQRGTRAGADPALLREVEGRLAALPPAEAAALLAPAVELAEQGLPSRSVLRKALEGMAKGIPALRVAEVLRHMQAHTEQAGRVVDPWLRRPEVQQLMPEVRRASAPSAEARNLLVENLAQAFLQEVPPATAAALLEQLPQQLRRGDLPAADVAAALGILADLPTARYQPEVTAQLVVAALEAGFSPADLRQLPLAVRAAQERRQVPADVVARAAAAQMTGGMPAAVLLQNLFQGAFPSRPPGVPPGLEKGRGQGGPPDGLPIGGPPPNNHSGL